ncbi:MAG: RluA family pseudouridine synthase, partial [Candidatus Binatia bacterium]
MAWEITVPPTEEPKSLENFLKKRFPIGYVRKLFRKKGVRLNSARAGPKEIARPGDRIQFFIPFEKRAQSTQQKTPSRGFEIIFENDDLIVVNKRAGIAAHEGKGVLKRHSLLGMLETLYRPQGLVPRLAHRIDKDTSGLLVVAKSEPAAGELEKRFEEGDVEKEYLALVVGHLYPTEGMIDFPLPGRDESAVRAVTSYRVQKEFAETTLVQVRIATGRMHQIRLHFAKLGHPVVMDDEHGDFPFNKRFRKSYG